MKGSPVGWGLKLNQLHLYKELRPPTNKCPRYDSKQSDSKAPIMLELWEMWSTSSLLLLPGPLLPGVVVPDMGQMNLFDT